MLALLSQVKVPSTALPTQTDPALAASIAAAAARPNPLILPNGELTRRGLNQIAPDMPMAEGGIVTRPTRALIGEAGAEAVIPLDRMGSMGATVNVNVAGSVISEGQLQSVIQDVLYNLNRTGAVTQLSNLGR